MKKYFIDCKSVDYNGLSVRVCGAFPSSRTIFFSSGKKTGKKGILSLYRSALEAVANGWNVAYIPGFPSSAAIEMGVYEKEGGSLFAFIPMGMGSVSRSLLSRCLVTGGGVISVVEDEATFSMEALNGACSVAATVSDATLVATENLRITPNYLVSALDEGRCVGVLESALNGKSARNLVRDGALTVSTLSGLLLSPRYITYPDKNGKYAIMGERFTLMDVERYEKR